MGYGEGSCGSYVVLIRNRSDLFAALTPSRPGSPRTDTGALVVTLH